MILFVILLLAISIETAFISSRIPKNFNAPIRRALTTTKKDRSLTSCKPSSITLYSSTKNDPNFKGGLSNLNYYLRDHEIMKRLTNGPSPVHLLNDPEFFNDVVEGGKQALASQLLRNGQKVKIIDENGNNLLVRIIEKQMSHLIGSLVIHRRKETIEAFHKKDAKTGHTPLSMAVELGDRIAIYEIVSPRLN